MNQTTNIPDFVDANNDGLPDVESESDLDLLLEQLKERTDRLLADPKRRYHDLTEWSAIMDLTEYAARWFDEDGNRIPVTPDPDPDVLNLSPSAVHLVEGEEPEFYDGLGGLYVSRQRSNGCVIIANPYLTGLYWRDNFEEVASDLQCSSRIIHMAGYHLVSAAKWCGLPLVPLVSAGRRRWTPAEGRFWISDGGTPFNDDEIRMCVFNYSAAAMHGSILAGAALGKAPFYQNPAQSPGETNRDLLPGHATWSAGQQPQTVVPKLIMKYNTPGFMQEAFEWALYRAHKIDDGDAKPVPGYVPPEEIGGDRSLAWREQFEDSDRSKLPRFSRRGLLRSS